MCLRILLIPIRHQLVFVVFVLFVCFVVVFLFARFIDCLFSLCVCFLGVGFFSFLIKTPIVGS